jgi:hypothetical protein
MCAGVQALAHFGEDIAIAFSGAEDVALIEYAHLTGRKYRVFRCGPPAEHSAAAAAAAATAVAAVMLHQEDKQSQLCN